MSVPLLDEDAPSAVDFVCCWLQPLLRAGIEREQDDPWPFALVQSISPVDIPEEGLYDTTIQIDVLHKVTTPGPLAADRLVAAGMIWAGKVHRRMTLLGTTYPEVTLSNGTSAGLDYLRVLMRPEKPVPSGDDSIVRIPGRYKLGLAYVAAT